MHFYHFFQVIVSFNVWIIVRLELHVAIFFHKFLRTFPQQTSIIFFAWCTQCDFFYSSLLTIWTRDTNQAYQDPFLRLNSVPSCGMWTHLYLILSILLPIFTHVTTILRPVQTIEHIPRHSLTRQPRTWCSLVFVPQAFFLKLLNIMFVAAVAAVPQNTFDSLYRPLYEQVVRSP